MSEGVSIVVCCHNSAWLLPETLDRLAAQQFTGPLPPCEVIVVDNASTDQTSTVARENWPPDCPIPLRVVPEPQLGLTSARLRGIVEANYALVCFVDDDNRVSSNWLETVSNLASEHDDVGAFGGQIEAIAEKTLPPWFHRFQNYYAVGQQGDKAGDVTDSRGYLWGAGLCLRKRAWQMLSENQFSFLLSDRKGQALSAGGDAELCYALRLAGWRLWYEPRLRMQHFLPESRLQWDYLRRVSRGFGAATAGIDAYEMAIKNGPTGSIQSARRTWSWQTLATISYLLRKPFKLLRASLSSMEGDADVLQIENLWGRLLELLNNRRNYVSNLRHVTAGKPHPTAD
ncbi:MAG TPA: glycosyltransferase [Pyrinomonadaceae bacterium]|nr:glycosyltransferase [Pyrinomonadaceae bacterium]